MATKSEEAATAQNAAPITAVKSRRGIGSARGTTRLKFDHKMAAPNGLFLGHIDDVSVKMVKIGEDTSGMPSFNGLEVPRLAITFASNEDDVNKRKYATLSFMAQESNAETIPGGKSEWKVNQIFDYLQHFMKVFILKGREFTQDEIDALALSFEDFDDEGQYLPVDVEVVIAGWTTLFENFATMMNTGRDGAPVFKTKDNKVLPIWGKLIRCIRTKKGWQNVSNGDLAFPAFVGEGVVEIFKQNTAPSIRIDAVREAILPKVVESAKKPNLPTAPGMPGGYSGAGVGIDSMNTGIADPLAAPGGIAMEAMEDSPF